MTTSGIQQRKAAAIVPPLDTILVIIPSLVLNNICAPSAQEQLYHCQLLLQTFLPLLYHTSKKTLLLVWGSGFGVRDRFKHFNRSLRFPAPYAFSLSHPPFAGQFLQGSTIQRNIQQFFNTAGIQRLQFFRKSFWQKGPNCRSRM